MAAPIPLLAPVTSAAVPASFDVMGVVRLLWMYGAGAAAGRPHVVHLWQSRGRPFSCSPSAPGSRLLAWHLAVGERACCSCLYLRLCASRWPDRFWWAVAQASSWARLLDSSRWASAWASRSLAFCSKAPTASAPAAKRSGGSSWLASWTSALGELGGVAALLAVHAVPGGDGLLGALGVVVDRGLGVAASTPA